jgi:hypothetical protein
MIDLSNHLQSRVYMSLFGSWGLNISLKLAPCSSNRRIKLEGLIFIILTTFLAPTRELTIEAKH